MPGAIETFEWTAMSFGLKNARTKYQRTTNYVFHDVIGKSMEIYIDDVVVKSRERQLHLTHLREAFERMRKFKFKMNPLKCAFGV